MNQFQLKTALAALAALAISACATSSGEKREFVSADLSATKIAVTASENKRGTWLTDTGYRLITPSFSLSRNCTVAPITGHVIYCESKFNGYSQVVRSDGSVVTWNLVETWSKDGCDASDGNGDYKVAQNTSQASFGWGPKSGESHHASAFIKFTDQGVVLTYRVRTASCP